MQIGGEVRGANLGAILAVQFGRGFLDASSDAARLGEADYKTRYREARAEANPIIRVLGDAPDAEETIMDAFGPRDTISSSVRMILGRFFMECAAQGSCVCIVLEKEPPHELQHDGPWDRAYCLVGTDSGVIVYDVRNGVLHQITSGADGALSRLFVRRSKSRFTAYYSQPVPQKDPLESGTPPAPPAEPPKGPVESAIPTAPKGPEPPPKEPSKEKEEEDDSQTEPIAVVVTPKKPAVVTPTVPVAKKPAVIRKRPAGAPPVAATPSDSKKADVGGDE